MKILATSWFLINSYYPLGGGDTNYSGEAGAAGAEEAKGSLSRGSPTCPGNLHGRRRSSGAGSTKRLDREHSWNSWECLRTREKYQDFVRIFA